MAKDSDTGTKEQTKFFGKAFPKLHGLVVPMMEALGERDTLEVLEARTPKVAKKALKAAKTTPKKPKKKVLGDDEEEGEEDGAMDLSDKVVIDKTMFKDWLK